MADSKKWLIKDQDGRIQGPLTTEAILEGITRGDFGGEEFVSLFPGSDWFRISQDPIFYDRLLEALAKDQLVSDYENIEETRSEIDIGPTSGLHLDPTLEEPEPLQRGKAHKITAEPPLTSQPEVDELEDSEHEAEDEAEEEPETFELFRSDRLLRREKLKRSLLPVALLLGCVALVALYLAWNDSSDVAARAHLIVPRPGQSELSSQEMANLMKGAMQALESDTLDGYQRAQNQLVRAVEGSRQTADPLALLCLTQFHLWPYTAQQAADLRAFSQVTVLAATTKPGSSESDLCRVAHLLVRGHMAEAKSIVDRVLDTTDAEATPPTLFYYFKGLSLEAEQQYRSAANYFSFVEKYWPRWLRPYVLEARQLRLINQPDRAHKRYSEIIQVNSNHYVAVAELGALEFEVYRHIGKAKPLLQAALGKVDLLPPSTISLVHRVLAEIAIAENDVDAVIRHAKTAYALDSRNERLRQILLKYAGQAQIDAVRRHDQVLMSEADQLVREGNCINAQALYKTAFEINPKNALAAVKAAECMWVLGLSEEAIRLLNAAARSDPDLIQAYVLLADYYSQNFNFAAAVKTLGKANQESPNNHEVLRGMALVELRRNNAKGAIEFANRALKIYDSDPETYVLLAKAYSLIKNDPKAFSEAYRAASLAIEIDPSYREGQIVFARTVASIQGVDAGLRHLETLIQNYPSILEYRIAYGGLLMLAERFALAESSFREVLAISPKYKKAQLNLARALRGQGRTKEALDAFFQAALLDSGDVEALFEAGVLLLSTGQPIEAKVQFQRVLNINKYYPLAHYHIGKADLQAGAHREALEAAQSEKNLNPMMPEPYMLAAESYAAMKNYSMCAREYQKAIEIQAQGADVFVKLARCHRLSGNLEIAKSNIEEAARQESGNPDVFKEQGQIFEMRGELEAAAQAYKQYLQLDPGAADAQQFRQRIRTMGFE